MFFFRPLPWEYGVRNLFRRPMRSVLTLCGLALVVLLILIVVSFLQGLDTMLSISGDPQVVLIHSLGAAENIENSSIPANRADLLGSSLREVERRFGMVYSSSELYLGTHVETSDTPGAAFGIVRGVTQLAPLVRRQVQIIEGRWPGSGEVLVGSLAAAKLGRGAASLAIGQNVTFEGRAWRISGAFRAGGSSLDSELWCPLVDLQQAMKRQDLSLVALTLSPGASPSAVKEFCRERRDLELEATAETDYFRALQNHYRPVRMVAWLVVALIAGAGVFAGLNTMYGAVVGRVRELATLQTIGFSRRAIVVSLIQEGVLLAAAAALLAGGLAVLLINESPVRFTMGAFALRVDSLALIVGCGTGMLIGIVGALPPAVRALRMPIAAGVKAV